MNRYLSSPDEIDRILKKGAEDAAKISEPILADVRKVMGFFGA